MISYSFVNFDFRMPRDVKASSTIRRRQRRTGFSFRQALKIVQRKAHDDDSIDISIEDPECDFRKFCLEWYRYREPLGHNFFCYFFLILRRSRDTLA